MPINFISYDKIKIKPCSWSRRNSHKRRIKKVVGGTGSGSGVKSCGKDDCKVENNGLGCAGDKSCQWSYSYGMCKCLATLA